jgi:hypothetical protein
MKLFFSTWSTMLMGKVLKKNNYPKRIAKDSRPWDHCFLVQLATCHHLYRNVEECRNEVAVAQTRIELGWSDLQTYCDNDACYFLSLEHIVTNKTFSNLSLPLCVANDATLLTFH